MFSERARDEFAFLKPWQQAVLKEALRPLPVLPEDDRGRPVAHGQGRRVLEVEGLRVVFRTEPRAVQISTIRGGPVLDPEHTGPAAKSSMSWRPG